MILSTVCHGVAEEFVQFCAGLRVNKRSRITLDRIHRALARKQWPRWPTNFSKEAYYVWPGMCRTALPKGAVHSGESTIALMRADNRKPVHASLTKPSRLSIANKGPLQFRKLWRSIVRRDVVVWVDKWWHAQCRANPVKPNVCLDVTAMAVLHTTPLPLFLGQPSLQDLVDRVNAVAIAVVQHHTQMLKVCNDMCNAPISLRTICDPLDIAREAGRQRLGALLKPNVVPATLFQCSRLSSRNKKSSKFISPPTKPTSTWWQNMLFASLGSPRWYAYICCIARCHVKKTCFQKQFLLEYHWNTVGTSYLNVAGTSNLQ